MDKYGSRDDLGFFVSSLCNVFAALKKVSAADDEEDEDDDDIGLDKDDASGPAKCSPKSKN